MWRPYFVFGFGGSNGQVRMASFALRMVWKREERRVGERFHNFLTEGGRMGGGKKEGRGTYFWHLRVTHVFVNDHALYQCSLLQFSPDLPIHLDQFKVHVPTFQVRYGENSFHCNLSHVALTTVDAGEREGEGEREGRREGG